MHCYNFPLIQCSVCLEESAVIDRRCHLAPERTTNPGKESVRLIGQKPRARQPPVGINLKQSRFH